MGPEKQHPRADPALWPLLLVGGLLTGQVVLLQVALNRLAWGLYGEVLPAAFAVAAIYPLAWLVARRA